MKVTNNTSSTLVAFGFHTQLGRGDYMEISPGQTVDVQGPYLGEMGGGKCYVALLGEIICQLDPDNEVGFQVTPGNPLNLASGEHGITVYHYDDV